MIEEAYVSFETAKLLKEKGFDESCNYAYISDDEFVDSSNQLWREYNSQFNKIWDGYSAPTHQMAMRWLREVHGIFIEVNCNRNNLELTCAISKVEDDFGDKVYEDVGFYFQTYSYEEAVEAALKYCLTNLI